MSNKPQKKIDGLWDKTLFKIIPHWLKPNFFTALRFILIPVVLYYIAVGSFVIAGISFIVAVLADTIDGSLARVRGQISSMGRFLDPVADKLLIILTILFLVYYYPVPALLIVVAVMDVAVMVVSGIVYALFPREDMPGPNIFGKLKMFGQSIGTILLFVYFIFSFYWILLITLVLFLLVMILEFASSVVYTRDYMS